MFEKRLQKLYCYNCSSITSISIANKLKCSVCEWFNIKNPEFDHNIKKLKRLQKWFKDIMLGKRLKKITLQIIPLYYHPLAKGEYLYQREMLRLKKSIQDSLYTG